jgi:hypothetical protein
MKKLVWLLLLLPLLLWAEVITYSPNLPALRYDATTGGFESEEGAGWSFTTAPGSYRLPVQTVNLILPPDAENITTVYTAGRAESIPGERPQLNSPYSDGSRYLSSDAVLQPSEPVASLGTGRWGEVQYVRFTIFPCLYDESAKAYRKYDSFTLSVQYERGGKSEAAAYQVPKLLYDDASFANKEVLTRWYGQGKSRLYDYLVITTPELYNAAQSLVSYRQSQGLVTAFADIATVLANTGGTTPADKLRNYLIGEYINAGFTYLLLIGDIDLIPIAYLTPEPNGFETVPSDFYYSDLSSNFDSDNDGKLGEYNSGMDFTPELYVGRIPWNDTSTVSQIADRAVSFETTGQSYRNRVLLPAAMLNYAAEDNEGLFERTDGAVWAEYCKNTALRQYQVTTMYEQAGLLPSFPSDYPLRADTLAALLANQNWGIVNWSAHGSPTSSARKVWMTDSDNDNLPDSFEMNWYTLVENSTFTNLPNQNGSVYFCASCLNGTIDGNEPSLGEWLLRKKAVADIAATRTGWYKIGWENPGWGGLSSYNYHFLENYASHHMTVGQAHAYANLLHTQYCLFGDPIDSNGIIWPELQNIYTYMLFGDPAIGYPSQTSATAGNILIWEPVGNTGQTIVNQLLDLAPFNVVYATHLIDTYNYLNQFDAVFCLFGLGYGPDVYNLQPTSFEYQYLLSYLQQGGKVYMEGMLNWNGDDPLLGRFGTIAPFDHVAMIDQIRYGNIGMEMILWDYDGYNGGTQALATSGATAQPLFWSYNQDYVSDIIAVWNQLGSSRTIGSSYNLAGAYSDVYPNTLMLSIILDTLDVWHQAPVANADTYIVPAILEASAAPNPFSELLQIAIKADKPVRISIYNTKGQTVRETVATVKNGIANWIWDGRNSKGNPVSEGIYLVRVSVGTGSRVLKTLRLR